MNERFKYPEDQIMPEGTDFADLQQASGVPTLEEAKLLELYKKRYAQIAQKLSQKYGLSYTALMFKDYNPHKTELQQLQTEVHEHGWREDLITKNPHQAKFRRMRRHEFLVPQLLPKIQAILTESGMMVTEETLNDFKFLQFMATVVLVPNLMNELAYSYNRGGNARYLDYSRIQRIISLYNLDNPQETIEYSVDELLDLAEKYHLKLLVREAVLEANLSAVVMLLSASYSGTYLKDPFVNNKGQSVEDLFPAEKVALEFKQRLIEQYDQVMTAEELKLVDCIISSGRKFEIENRIVQKRLWGNNEASFHKNLEEVLQARSKAITREKLVDKYVNLLDLDNLRTLENALMQLLADYTVENSVLSIQQLSDIQASLNDRINELKSVE